MIVMDATLQNAAVALGNGEDFTCKVANKGGIETVVAQVQGITTATITWEATVNGTNWVAIQGTNLTSGAAASDATVDGLYRIDARGLLKVRARISAYTAGTITVTAKGVNVNA